MQNLIEKAAMLMEALPYIQRFRSQTFVVKYGGSFMDSPDPEVRSGVARDVVFVEAVGINPVVVHGGGKAISAAMEKAGILERVVRALVSTAHSVGALIATTVATCIGVNALAADQYMSIVITGRMFGKAFRERGLHQKNLARTLEDAGTITSPLVPWNTCGAYMAATLGVATFAYLPFAFFNLINPLVSVAYGFSGITIKKLEPDPAQA